MRFLTVSNALTFLRLLLSPFVAYAIVLREWKIALGLFMLASLTDFLDGYCARLFNDQTRFGAALDPLADKVLILSCFIALAFLKSDVFYVPIWFVLFFLCREMCIVFGALVIALFGGQSDPISPTLWGKATTFLQVVFLMWLFMCYIKGWQPQRTYAFFLAFLVVFSSFSFVHYASIAFSFFKKIRA